MPASRAVLADVAGRLAAAGCVAAAEEAAELVSAVPDANTLEAYVGRREQGEPLAWITGAVRFCGRRVLMTAGMFVPRPQSEELAFRAAALLAARGPGGRAADLCTGSGAVASHLAAAGGGATVVGVDREVRAVGCARRNGVRAIVGDVGEPLRSGVFDVVTAVAPYVPTGAIGVLPSDVQRYEPRVALDGGPDGLDLVRRVVDAGARLLRPGGWLLAEIGGDQDRALAPVLERFSFRAVDVWHDEDGDLRGLAAQATGGTRATPG